MPHKHYMTLPIFVFYYNKIKDPKSTENDVDNFWLNLLGQYFTAEKMFGIEYESRPLKQLEQRTDFTIRYIRNGALKKVILMENKRKGFETQTSKWDEALEQLSRCMTLVRTEKGQDPDQVLYGAVNIGPFTRFYQLNPRATQCIDYAKGAGKYFEVADNEHDIHEILTELVEKTRH